MNRFLKRDAPVATKDDFPRQVSNQRAKTSRRRLGENRLVSRNEKGGALSNCANTATHVAQFSTQQSKRAASPASSSFRGANNFTRGKTWAGNRWMSARHADRLEEQCRVSARPSPFRLSPHRCWLVALNFNESARLRRINSDSRDE